MNKQVLFGVYMLAFLSMGAAQAATIDKNMASITNENNGWTTSVTFYTPSIVRVSKYPGQKAPDKKSYSVIIQPKNVAVEAGTSESGKSLKSSSICATLLNDGSVTFSDVSGNILLSESNWSHTPCENKVDAGKFKVSQSYTLAPDEVIFGLGQRQCPELNQRGQDVRIWTGNANITIPYFTSDKGYGLYWDNAGDSRFTDVSDIATFTSEVAPSVDYYFIYKDGTQDGVIAGIRTLTGDATMFPIQMLGHWQCRERYKSSDELCDVLDKYRDLQIPLDGMVQDWQYWGCDSNWNAMKFVNPHYINKMGDKKWMRYLPNDEDPNAKYPEPRIKSPEDMVSYVHDNNSHLMISIWANFGPWTDQYKELAKIGALLPFDTWPRNRGVLPYDPFNPKARDIYWKYLTSLYKMGIDAWWTDSTEPDHFENPGDGDYMTHDGSWRSVKNAFSLMTNKGIYEHQRKMKGNNKRSMQMTRCGTFGIQRYGTFCWSGDVSSNWAVMKNQIPSGLNFIICGIPYWNTDIGGFFGWDFNNDPKNPAMQELQVRWMQWGTFMPMMRNHCSSPMVSELYNFGDPGDWAFDAQKKAIALRYRLMPYIYSLAGDVAHHSGTMMRPLVMDFASDKRAIKLNDQYMFGKNILVKPVTDPLYTYTDDKRNGHCIYPDLNNAAAPVTVYLPEGTKWFDFWSNEIFEGGKDVQFIAPIDRMPIYVKAGSIIPFGPEVQYTTEKPWDNLELRIYPGADGEFVLYEDDGTTYDYEKGLFSEIPVKWDENTQTLTIGKRQGSYPNMLSERMFNIEIMKPGATSGDKVPSQFSKSIKYNGESVSLKI